MRGGGDPLSIKPGEIYHKRRADFILKHAACFFLKGHSEAQRHWPLFELVVWVFFIKCVWQKDNTLPQSAIHLRFQVAPGEFNLKSVGLDTLVINQLHPHVCVSVCVCRSICLCLWAIHHCLILLYRTHNAWASFSPLKINPTTSDVLTIAGQGNEILLTQLQQKAQSESPRSAVIQGSGD